MIQDTTWMKGAPCSGRTELFFPPSSSEPSRVRYKREREAKELCKSCPVLAQCRDHARANDEMGIWGGETERERWEAGYMRTNIVFRRRQMVAQSRQRLREKRLLEQSSATQSMLEV